MECVKGKILPEMNKVVEGPEISSREFLEFLGLCFYGNPNRISRQDYFSSSEMNFQHSMLYHLNCWISGTQFRKILEALWYTKKLKQSLNIVGSARADY